MNHLKAVSSNERELRVANYMVLFGGKDLVGEFFTPQTSFRSCYTDLGMLYMDFEHGLDPDRIGNDRHKVIGMVDWSTAKSDSNGIWVERVLNRRAEYIDLIEELLDAGVLGSSSEAISSQTTKKSNGEIIEWPLMRDSLTVTPMEPRMAGPNVVTAAKSLRKVFPHAKSLARVCGDAVDLPPAIKAIDDITDFKSACTYLRNAGGFSRSEATAIVSRLKHLSLRNAEDDEAKQLLAALSRRTELLRA